VVRRTVGYARRDTPEELELQNELYSQLRLCTNYFQPVMKLREKTRTGSRVTKKYDKAETPFHRVLKSRRATKRVKNVLRRDYAELNPVKLGREIERLCGKLHAVGQCKAEAKPCSALEHIST
jgi:hypothetical protein